MNVMKAVPGLNILIGTYISTNSHILSLSYILRMLSHTPPCKIAGLTTLVGGAPGIRNLQSTD